MTVLDPREAFEAVARGPDARIDLARAALLVAAEEYPGLDVDAYLGRLDAVAAEAAERLAGASDAERAVELGEFLFRDQGFAGNAERYDDPRNSFLNEVLDRRLGIPITLCLLYMEVARRISLPAEGIGFPGHFLARAAGEEGPLVDAFHGRVLSREACAGLLREMLGPDAQLDPRVHLRAATPREILVRLVGNLKHLYARERDFGRALACCERILLLVPDSPLELRDRGLVYEQLECFAAARDDLECFLRLSPEDPTAPVVRDRVVSLGRRVTQLH